MIATVGVSMIDLYQRHLSPRKGFCCAYRKRHGSRRASCSAFARRVLERFGVVALLSLMGRRFDRCRDAAVALRRDGGPVLDYRDGGADRAARDERRRERADQVCSAVPGDCSVPDLGCALDGVSALADVSACDVASGCDVAACSP